MLFPFQQSTGETRRVVVTGGGIVTALGTGWRLNAAGFRVGRRAIRPVRGFDVSRQRVKVAAEVDWPDVIPTGHLSRSSIRRLDPGARMLLLAGDEAWCQCGWSAGEPPFPLVLGTTCGGMSLGETYYRTAVNSPEQRREQPWRAISYQAQRQARMLAGALGCDPEITIIANACASGANAIGTAWDRIRHGFADRALAGGYDALCQLVFAGFDSLQALSPTTCRPFAASRDGLALGEGAAVLALETLDSARDRDAEILGEIIGYGAATDVHHLTQPHPDGAAAFATMTAACRQAGLAPAEVDYVNAHGTGTPMNDVSEAAALNRWAGNATAGLRVSSTKAGVGHLLGAAGAVEAAVCLMALQGGWLPPQIAGDDPDPVCRFKLVTEPTDAPVQVALTNSFGFGGANATLLLRRFA